MRAVRPAFLPLWTFAVAATVSAFVVHLALRGRTVQLGYDLGRARQEQAHMREVRRVLQLEAASYKTPERIEIVARTLLGMEPPPPDRIVSLPALPALTPLAPLVPLAQGATVDTAAAPMARASGTIGSPP